MYYILCLVSVLCLVFCVLWRVLGPVSREKRRKEWHRREKERIGPDLTSPCTCFPTFVCMSCLVLSCAALSCLDRSNLLFCSVLLSLVLSCPALFCSASPLPLLHVRKSVLYLKRSLYNLPNVIPWFSILTYNCFSLHRIHLISFSLCSFAWTHYFLRFVRPSKKMDYVREAKPQVS